jgi:2-hydroxy-3-oxopropionate reductase
MGAQMTDQTTVGFIGLGIMGRHMARNLLKAGFPLVVYDLLPQAMTELSAAGATAVTSPKALAGAVDVIVLCLPDSPDVQAAMSGPEGILAGASPGKLIIDMSTISPMAARELSTAAAQQGVAMLDAQVSGGEIGAINGTLSIMVGGDAQAFAQAQPVLQVMGKTILHMGAAGAGQVTKACNQMIIAAEIAVVAEAMVMAAKAGVDPAKVREALLGGHAYSRVLESQGERFLQHNFQPGFRTRLQYKDLNIALDTARAYGAPVPTSALVQQLYSALMAQGQAEQDHSILINLFEALAAQQVTGTVESR